MCTALIKGEMICLRAALKYSSRNKNKINNTIQYNTIQEGMDTLRKTKCC